jgi:methionine-rich copper-binding protein CopC
MSLPNQRRFCLGPMQSVAGSRKTVCLLCVLFCSLVMLLGLPSIALANPAHAEYVSSDPVSNAILTKAPTMVTIHFSEQVVPAESDITVYDVNYKVVSTGAAAVDRADLKTMTVTMAGDQSEVYVINWHTLSAVEGHRDAGSFRFFVNISPMFKAMVAGNSSMMSGASTSSSGAMSAGSASSSSPSGLPLWITVLVGVLGLLLGGVVVFAFIRGSKSSSRT